MIGSALVVIRCVVVWLWSITSGKSFTENVWVEIGLSVLSYLTLLSIVGAVVAYYAQRLSSDLRYDNIVSATTLFSVATLGILLFSALVPIDVHDARPTTILSAIAAHVLAVSVYVLSVVLGAFIAVVHLQRRHRATKSILVVLGGVVVLVWTSSIFSEQWRAFSTITIIFTIVGILVSLLSIRRLHWISTLTLDKKIRLLWLTACGASATVILASMLAFNSSASVTLSTEMFLCQGAVIPALISAFGFTLFVRLFFAALVSLPNSGIVDRKTSEVEALSGLTRLITQSVTVDQLLESTTQYSLSVCRAHGAWCEIYEGDTIRVVAPQLVTAEYVGQLHRNLDFDRLIKEAIEPLHIESLAELYEVPQKTIRSVIIIPITADELRLGSLVMFSTLEYGFEYDDLQLLSAFGNIIGVGLEQARLMQTALDRERLKREIEVAKSVQRSLLPKHYPSTAEWQVEATMVPAAQVGGDYFDFVEFAGGTCGALIADVSGKGVPASFYMATLKGIVLAQVRSATGPADLLKKVNGILYRTMEKGTYISVVCLDYNRESQEIRLARAGHTPVLVGSEQAVKAYVPRGAAIGLLPSEQFDAMLEEVTIPIQSDTVCLLTTDGVTERRNQQNDELTIEPLMALMPQCVGKGAEALLQQTLNVVEAFSNGTEPHDDIAIVAIHIRPTVETSSTFPRTHSVVGVSL